MKLKNLLTALSGLAFLACSDNKQCREWDFNQDGLYDQIVCSTPTNFRRTTYEYDKDGFQIKKSIYGPGQPTITNEFWPNGNYRKTTVYGKVYHFDNKGKMIDKPQEE